MPLQISRPSGSETRLPVSRHTLDPADILTVLSVSSLDQDHRMLESIFSHSRWRLSSAYNCEEAVAHVRNHKTPVVVTETQLAGACWRTMLRRLIGLNISPPPRLIVTARLADDQLWSEVLNLGGYNVLEKPFDHREVCWVVSHAWLDWKAERDRLLIRPLARSAGA